MKAAKQHIGTKSSGRRDNKPGYSAKVKKTIRDRNILRLKAKQLGGREKWLSKCKEVKEMIRKEKEDKWKEYVEELDSKTNPKQEPRRKDNPAERE